MNRDFVLQNVGSDPAAVYAEDYFRDYYRTTSGHSYEEREVWMPFMRGVAQSIVQACNPRTVLDCGCAYGYLVEALRDLGVDAQGVDVSAFAVGNARGSASGHCSVKDIGRESIDGRYDLIACIEVLEHIPEDRGLFAVRNLCAASDTVLFSSTADDFADLTHVCVRSNDYWRSRFCEQGFLQEGRFGAIARDAYVYSRPAWWTA